jgi:hypothetical protein
VVAQQRGDLVAIGRPESGLVRAVLRQPDRADDPLADLMGQQDPRQAQSDQPGEGGEGRRDERNQGDPLDRPLTGSTSVTLERS